MGKVLKDSPLVFTRAAVDEIRDSQQAFDVYWTVVLLDSPQRGVFEIHISVRPLEGSPADPPVVHYVIDWPNSHAITFEAQLYQACCKTNLQVAEWRAVNSTNERKGNHTR